MRSSVTLTLAMLSLIACNGKGDETDTDPSNNQDTEETESEDTEGADTDDTSSSDDEAPTPGSEIIFTDISANSVMLHWGAATDNMTDGSELSYSVVSADSADAIDELDEAQDAPVMTTGSGITEAEVTGLNDSTTYFFAVLVTDEAGNDALYAPQEVTTLGIVDETSPEVSTLWFSDVSSSSLMVNWDVATDDQTAQGDLEYKLVAASSIEAIDTFEEIEAIVDPIMDWTMGTTSFEVSGLSEGDFAYYAVLVKDEAGNASLYFPLGRVAGKMIYVTQESYTSAFGGVEAADDLCVLDEDPQVDQTANVIAMLAVDGEREAPSIDWALMNDASYYNYRGQLIGDTDGNGLLPSTLQSALVYSDDYDNTLIFTGIDDNWQTLTDNCAGYTDDTALSGISMGDASLTDSAWLYNSNTTCLNTSLFSNLNAHVVCVEQ